MNKHTRTRTNMDIRRKKRAKKRRARAEKYLQRDMAQDEKIEESELKFRIREYKEPR